MFALLASLPLLVTATSAAATGNDLQTSARELCRQERPLVRQIWEQGLYDTSPQIAAIMIDAANGNTANVLRSLHGIAPDEVVRWRQVALMTAVGAGQSATADALLDDGAAVNGLALMPSFKAAAYEGIADAMAKDSHFGDPKTVKGLEASGLMNNDPRQTGPALLLVMDCDDIATANVLLRHHADPMITTIPGGADPLTIAVATGWADIAEALLDHGADPCLADQRRRQTAEGRNRPTPHTIAQIAQHAGLPTALVKRLECNAAHP